MLGVELGRVVSWCVDAVWRQAERCQRLGDASFLCTATKVLAPGSNNVFTVTVRPRVRFAATDSIRFEAQATVISDPISGDNSAVLVLP